MKIYLVNNIKKIDDDSLGILQRLLKHEKLERVNKYYKKADRQRSIVGDALIRFILSVAYVISDDMSFTCNEYGKPYLINQRGIEFNLTHSGDFVACALDTMPIGIDIEKIGDIDLSIAKYFFSSQEYNDLVKHELSERLVYFYDLWTLKESYVKAKGKGLSIALDTFSIRKEDEVILMEGIENYYFKQYHIEEDYILSVCARNNNFPDCVTTVKLEDLVQYAIKMKPDIT